MTQKELLYYEDAIGHEDSIISICEYCIDNLTDDELVSFMETELDTHTKLREKLLDKLKEKANE